MDCHKIDGERKEERDNTTKVLHELPLTCRDAMSSRSSPCCLCCSVSSKGGMAASTGLACALHLNDDFDVNWQELIRKIKKIR